MLNLSSINLRKLVGNQQERCSLRYDIFGAIVGNACPLTRITTTNEVPSRKPIVLDSESPRKPRKNKNTKSVSKTKVVQIVLWYLDSGCSKHMTGDRSQLTNFISKFLGQLNSKMIKLQR
ncbi:hypothetical protein Tco_0310017 [Tanacetum coccineum]